MHTHVTVSQCVFLLHSQCSHEFCHPLAFIDHISPELFGMIPQILQNTTQMNFVIKKVSSKVFWLFTHIFWYLPCGLQDLSYKTICSLVQRIPEHVKVRSWRFKARFKERLEDWKIVFLFFSGFFLKLFLLEELFKVVFCFKNWKLEICWNRSYQTALIFAIKVLCFLFDLNLWSNHWMRPCRCKEREPW